MSRRPEWLAPFLHGNDCWATGAPPVVSGLFPRPGHSRGRLCHTDGLAHEGAT